MSANKEQQEAIESSGNLMIVAGPGSGKTFTMIQKIKYLIDTDKARPEDILVLTFTNKAAGELRARLSKIGITGVKAGTFHSYCFEELCKVEENLKIATEKDIDFIYKSLEISDSEKSYIHSKRCGASSTFDVRKEFVLKQYVQELRNRELIDFNDILINFIKNDEIEIKKKVVIIDEFQDTSKMQYNALRKISANSSMVNAVGDDSQSIYAFNGANMSNMHEFVKEYNAKIIMMEKNYRSTSDICDVANKLMDNSKETIFHKKIESVSGKRGPVIICNGDFYDVARKAENECKGEKSVAVICRTNRTVSEIRKRIGRKDLILVPFMEHQKDSLRCIFKLFDGDFKPFCESLTGIDFGNKTPSNRAEFFASRKISENTKEKISKSLEKEDPVQAFEFYYGSEVNYSFRQWYYRDVSDEKKYAKNEDKFDDIFAISEAIHKINNKNKIDIITAHGSKGLEYNTVIIPEFNKGKWPSGKNDWKTIEEERRIFYVAITRAEESLYIFKDEGEESIFRREIE